MTATASLASLSKNFRGRILRPGDEEYDSARRIWNAAFDRRPALIAQAADASDVAEALRFARREGLPLAVRGGGHSIPGHSSVDGGLVIDLSRMRAVHVDPEARTARAQAGATWADVDRATHTFGLATPGGQISDTGIAGLTLGGGIGWLMRKHGLVVDNLLEVELVTPDSRVVRASERENADLFWGLRGGGGNFGVATAFTYRLHPLEHVVGGPMFYSLEDAPDVIRHWREWIADAPEEMGSFLIFMAAPPAPFVPPEHQGKPALILVTCYAGPEQEAERLLAPLRAFRKPFADLVARVPYPDFQASVDHTAPYGRPYYVRSQHLAAFPDGAVEPLLGAARAILPPWGQIHLGALGGAIARVPEDATAYPNRDVPFTLLVVASWEPGEDRAPHVAWARSATEALAPFAKGAYVNHLGEEGQDRVRAAYGAEKYARLQALKAKYDPENVLRLNQNVSPSGRPA